MRIDIPNGAVTAADISIGHQVISAVMDLDSLSGRRIGIGIIIIIETVPPIQMIFGQIRLTGFAVIGPGAGH